MRVCAEATEADLETAIAKLGGEPAFEELRPPQTGLVMLRGRIGGSGSAFNLGEATVTRAVVKLQSGAVGYSYLLGRSTGTWAAPRPVRPRTEASARLAPVGARGRGGTPPDDR
jgi:alpha-D-ribose 1-methylphosphonate 5-triphosphate synthase subunit PhnG